MAGLTGKIFSKKIRSQQTVRRTPLKKERKIIFGKPVAERSGNGAKDLD